MANSRDATDYGYYTSLKEVPQRSKGETFNDSWQAFATNDYVIRYTDVMLMRAEALIELGRLSEARVIINDIRRRAANSVNKHIEYAADQCQIARISCFSVFRQQGERTQVPALGAPSEMAMENGRFFDLRRWGVASQTLNAYFASEQNSTYSFFDHNGNVMEARQYHTMKTAMLQVPGNSITDSITAMLTLRQARTSSSRYLIISCSTYLDYTPRIRIMIKG